MKKLTCSFSFDFRIFSLSGDDHCVDPNWRNAMKVFRLKLYWEKGYRWQGVRYEKKVRSYGPVICL